MNYKTLREEAYEANREIPLRSLAIYTWGNVSAFDNRAGVFAIKPSGVDYDALSPENMVIVDLNGNVVEGNLRPSSDTETHRILYRDFDGIAGVTHTHSPYACGWAQAARPVPVFGTTHADYTQREIPCTPFISAEAVRGNYERETGNLITGYFRDKNIDPHLCGMVLVAGHGPFTWGKNAAESLYHSAVLEEVCKMALFTIQLKPGCSPLPAHIIKKHWERKHGDAAYYGQSAP
jgi:L-ribulose-5-phosphate 4-epimerase